MKVIEHENLCFIHFPQKKSLEIKPKNSQRKKDRESALSQFSILLSYGEDASVIVAASSMSGMVWFGQIAQHSSGEGKSFFLAHYEFYLSPGLLVEREGVNRCLCISSLRKKPTPVLYKAFKNSCLYSVHPAKQESTYFISLNFRTICSACI